MSAPGAVSPPPIGEALRVAWQTFQRYPVPIVLGTLCAILVSLIPLAGVGLAFAGFMKVSLKALRGQAPEAADGFAGLFDNAIDHIVMGLLQLTGFLACCVGVYVTQALFSPGTVLILERGASWEQAMNSCLEQVKPNWVEWTLFTFVVMALGASGMLLCFAGVLVTAPVAMLAMAYAYDRSFGAGPVPAA